MNDNELVKDLLQKSWTKRQEGKYQEAQHLVWEAHRICDPGAYASLGRIFHIYAQFYSDQKRSDLVLEFLQQSLFYYKKSGDPDKIAHSTRHIADLQFEIGFVEESKTNYDVVIQY